MNGKAVRILEIRSFIYCPASRDQTGQSSFRSVLDSAPLVCSSRRFEIDPPSRQTSGLLIW
jgi:hypothetical protein